MPARIVVRLKRIKVFGDGDPMGSSDMQFRFIDGAGGVHFIGRFPGTSAGDTINLDQRIYLDCPNSGTLSLGFHVVDEDEGDDEIAVDRLSTNVIDNRLPRTDLRITATRGDLSATLYFDLAYDNVASAQSISEYVRLYEHENANGAFADLQDDVPGPALTQNTMRLFCGSVEFSHSVGLYLSSTLNFQPRTVSSIVMPGNAQVVLFSEALRTQSGGIKTYSKSTDWVPGNYTYFSGPRGRIVNLTEHTLGLPGSLWNDRANSFRTDTLRVVGKGVRVTAEPFVRVFSGPDGTGQWFDLRPENGRHVWRKEFHTSEGTYVLDDYDFDATRFMGELPHSLLLNANTLLTFQAGNTPPTEHHKLGGEPAGRMFNLRDLPRNILSKPGRPANRTYAGVVKTIRASILSRR